MSSKTSSKRPQSHLDHPCISSDSPANIRNMTKKMLPLNFPLSKTVLWDCTPVGDVIGMHFSYYRNPRLLVTEKALRLSYRHAKTEKKPFICFLLGSFSIDEDEEGITLTIDRFDPGRAKSDGLGKVPNTLLPGELAIPCSVSSRGSQAECDTALTEDFATSLVSLQSHLHSKEVLDLSKLLSVRAHITYTEDMDNLHFDLHWAAVTLANTFESTAIKPVPIIPTALARNLSSHNNIAQLQGTHKCGYLTMDQTRKLLLVLESDPKVYTLPLVGIWLSGVIHIHSPQVWSSCLRYVFSSSINDRVLSESGSFLIVLYSLTHKEPEFYECTPCSGHDPLALQLLTCEEALHLFKNAEASRKHNLQFELSSESHNSGTYFFNEVSKTISSVVFKQNTSPNKLSISDHDSGVEEDDLSPRPSPQPHPSVQQATRIHPSVPELSLVFGSFNSVSSSHNAENVNRKNLSSSTALSASNQFTCPSSTSNQKPHSEYHPKDSELKSFSSNLHSKSLKAKTYKGKQSPADNPSTPHLKSNSQVRRSSGSSSSSSLSTPQRCLSPDSSVYPIKSSTEHNSNCNVTTPRQGPTEIRRSYTFSSRHTPSPQSPNHNVAFPHQSKHLQESSKQTPSVAPLYHPSVGNCCHNHGPVQCHSSGSWPSPGNNGIHNKENLSDSSDGNYPIYQNGTCPNICCSPVCINSCPKSSGLSGRVNCCSSPIDMSPGRRDLPVNLCSPQSCAHTSPPMMPSANGMLGLSAEAYRLLADQDKQLKVLQAQIQRLLEAQTSHTEISNTCIKSGSLMKKVESVSTETQELGKKSSVSIAVSTGASLFWNSPCPEEDAAERPDDSAFCNELSVAVNSEEDTSRTTIASSLQAVDICSFSESSQLVDSGKNNYIACLDVSPMQSDHPVPASLGIQAAVTEGSAEVGPPVQCIPQEKFYHNLLNQVNNILKSSTNVDEVLRIGNDTREQPATCEPSTDKSEKCRPTNTSLTDQTNVLEATLKQLKSIGVNIDLNLSDMKRKSSDTVDSASILACINPDALIPRLNSMSFTNMGLSGFVPSGVDLSMEANAIALKYLSESQLTQLSLSHRTKNNPLDSSSFQNLLPGNTEKSMVGFSLILPNNMSFATKKYMKRYGLLESTGSDDESELYFENSCSASQTKDENLSKKQLLAPNASSSDERLEYVRDDHILNGKCINKVVGLQSLNQPEANKLRNITNEMSGTSPAAAQQSGDSSLWIPKDSKTKSRLSSGKAPFLRHHEKENTRDPPFLHEMDSGSSGKRSSGVPAAVGDILDVNRLRQLPKLF